jgi:hypothetical protein
MKSFNTVSNNAQLITLNKIVVTQPATNENQVLSYLSDAAVLVIMLLVIHVISAKDDFADVDLVLPFQSANCI